MREFTRYIERLVRRRRPEGFTATPDEAAAVRAAVTLRAANEEERIPRPEFVADLRARLAADVAASAPRPARGDHAPALGNRFPAQGDQAPARDERFPGQSFPGQSFPGQSFPGQSFPGQSFPGQSERGGPRRATPRRSLLIGTSAAAAAAAVAVVADRNLGTKNTPATPSALEPSSPGSSSPGPSDLEPSALDPQDGGVWHTVLATSDLPGNGALAFDTNVVSGFVMRIGGVLSARSGICTHQGCKLGLNAPEKRLACPCHRTFFAYDGTVIRSQLSDPPPPLPQFHVRELDGQIQILLPRTA